MKQEIDWEILYRYLDHRLTADDEIILNKWLQADKRYREQLDCLRKIWAAPEILLPPPDMEQAWLNINNKITAQEQAANRTAAIKQKESRISYKWQIYKYRILPAAALVLIFIISAIVMLQHRYTIKMKEITVGFARLETVMLPDNSRIILDAGSKLRYPEEFKDNERNVYLEGEGYFDVAHIVSQPFVVHAGNAVITVLGTRFNVRAWQKENKVTVAVARGTVLVNTAEEKDPQLGVSVRDSQYTILGETGRPSLPLHTDIARYLSWIQREIYFQNTPLRVVLDQMQRWYDTTFELPDEQAAANPITLYISNKFSYQQHGDSIIFLRKH
jgi:transmembrane sensor